MPDLISPAPQRVIPEIPENMQDNIAQLEHQARAPHRIASQHAVVYGGHPGGAAGYGGGSPYGPPMATPPAVGGLGASFVWPVITNPPPNVPPTDEQREATLEAARLAVLSSNDPESQVAWAQDALAYVEVAVQDELRAAAVRPPRPVTPPIERQLRSDATSVISFLADQNHPRAEFLRGMWLEFGKFGFRVDRKEAFRAYARSAERGFSRAEYRMGMQFENSNEPLKAIRHYERGVTLGDSASNYRLGMMILLGQHGQVQDYATGLAHIHFAADTCDENAPQGAYVYGMLLARELPQVAVPDPYLHYDIDAARMNIEKAAYHGFAKAQVKMGAAYELCQLGCDFDPALSLHYNVLAAHQGEPEAEMAISKWLLCGHEGLFEKNDELAFTFAKRAAQSGLATAEFALGYFYEVGIYVTVDLKEARVWYAKAASSGNKDASGRIDSISRSKTLSRKDHETVAIARIKSTRAPASGPRRRPPMRAPMTSQPSIQEAPPLEMPDPSRLTISGSTPYPEASFGAMPSQYGPRPNSAAFGINPNIRNHPPPHPGMGVRVPSAPVGGGPVSPGMPPTPSAYSSPSHTPAPVENIGFSAPPDPYRRRLQPTPHGGPNGRSPSPNPRMPGGPGPGGRGRGYPPPPVRADSSHSMSRPSTASSAGRVPSGPAVSSPPPQPPAKQNQGGLPGKGPKTFEEMGVPQTKSGGDCVVM